jgi:hypothetical protein
MQRNVVGPEKESFVSWMFGGWTKKLERRKKNADDMFMS